MAKKKAPGKTVAEILRLAETPSILDAGKPLPDLFERTRLDEVLEQTKAASDRLESPELHHWTQTGIADYERAFNDELARIEARAVFQSRQQPQAEAPADGESQKQRQARRYQACIDAGLTMPTDDYSHLPTGIGKLAKAEGITRQAFAEDVKAHIRQLNGR